MKNKLYPVIGLFLVAVLIITQFAFVPALGAAAPINLLREGGKYESHTVRIDSEGKLKYTAGGAWDVAFNFPETVKVLYDGNTTDNHKDVAVGDGILYDFGEGATIDSVKVYSGIDGYSDGITVYSANTIDGLLDNKIGEVDKSANIKDKVFTANKNAGRYVAVFASSSDSSVRIREIEVFGTQPEATIGTKVYSDTADLNGPTDKTVGFGADNGKKARYVMFTFNSFSMYEARMRELYIIGKKNGGFVNFLDGEADLYAVKETSAGVFEYLSETETNNGFCGDKLSYVKDGNRGAFSIFGQGITAGTYPNHGVLVDLKASYPITAIQALVGSTDSTMADGVDIYMAETLEALSLSETPKKDTEEDDGKVELVGNMIYSDGSKFTEVKYVHDKVIEFTEACEGQHLAIDFKHPSGMVRIREIEIYDDKNNKLTLDDVSKITYGTVTGGEVIRGDWTGPSVSDDKADDKLFDGDIQNHFDMYGCSAILVSLKNMTKISKVVVYTGIYDNAQYKHATDIYLGKSVEGLFDIPQDESEEFPFKSSVDNFTEADARKISASNLILGRTPQVINWNDKQTAGGDYKTSTFYDGSFGHKDIQCPEGANPTIVYDMLYPTKINAVMFAAMSGDGLPTYSTSYQIYVGDDFDTLISAKNLVAERDQTKVAEKDLAQAQLYVFDEVKTGRYVAFYVTSPSRDMTADYSAIARIAELGVYGKIDMSSITIDNTATDNDITTAHSSNLIAGLKAEVESGDISDSKIGYLTDGNTENKVSVTTGTKLIYTLSDAAVIKQLRIAGEKIKHFEFYISSDKNSLFYPGSRVADFEPTSELDKIFTLTFDEQKDNMLYIGFKILGGSADLTEVAVYGEYQDYLVDLNVTQATLDSYEGKNLFAGKTPTIKNAEGHTQTPTYRDETGEVVTGIGLLADGKIAQHVDIPAVNGLYITYSFDNKYIFDYMALCHLSDVTYVVKEYQIYIGNNLGSLYSPQNLVLSYDNTPNMVGAQGFSFSDKGPSGKPVGKYVGIYYPVANVNPNDVISRISELLAVGQEYAGQPDNLAENTSVNAYRTENGKPTEFTSSEFTQTEKSNLIKKGNTSAVSLKTNGKQLDLIIDLCQKVTFSEFALTAEKGNILKYDLYVADYLKDVWSSSSKTASYSAGAADETTLKISKEMSGRYLRVSIPANAVKGGTAKLYSISVIGSDTQKQDVVNQLYGITPSLILSDNTTGDWEAGFDYSALNYLSDSLTTFGGAFWGAEYGKQSLNLVYKMPNPKMINDVILRGLVAGNGEPLVDYFANDVKIYVGDSLEAAMSPTTAPVVSYKRFSDDVDSTVTLSFAPTQVSYLRICISETGSKKISSTMLAVFTEIEAQGIDIFNVLPAEDSEYALKLADKSGVKLNVVKLFDNDILPDYTTFRLTQKAVSKKDAEALRENALAPIGKMLTLEVFDFLGNSIKTFGGRSLEITIPVPGDGTFAMLAGIRDGEVVMLDAGYDDDGNLLYTEAEVTPTMQYVLVTYSDEVIEVVTPDDTTSDDDWFDDSYYDDDTDSDGTDISEEEPSTDDEPDTEETQKPKNDKKLVRKKKKVQSSGMDTATLVWIIVGSVAAVLVIGTVVTVVVVKKKKKAQ